MNRYTIDGVLGDLMAGKRIAVVSITNLMSQAAFKEVLTASEERWDIKAYLDRVLRGNGRQLIEGNGGAIHFFSHHQIRSGVIRGFSLDTVVLDYGDHIDKRRDAEYEVRPALMASGGDLIR